MTVERWLFRAGPVEVDEIRMTLTVGGELVRLEAKPLALLRALLRGRGSVVSKEALIEAAWGNAEHTSAGSLATAMSKVRSALGASGRDLIAVVHGSGYRITAPVEMRPAETATRSAALAPGDPHPGRPDLILEALPHVTSGRIWRARAPENTGNVVIKVALGRNELAGLRRECALAQTLQAALGPRPDLAPILGSRLDQPPYYIERPEIGPDLVTWAAAQGGLGHVPLATRLAALAALARTLAAAHAAGVPHGALEPSHLLVARDAGAAISLVPIGFLGAGAAPSPGHHVYAAPERLAGAELTIGMDIFALGVLLYQLVLGDLSRPLGVGWEADIADPLLRDDIACAACANPARRLASAANLADRLDQLGARQQSEERQRTSAAEAEAWRRLAERNRLRRPWVIAAASSLAAGIVLAGAFALRATSERNAARQQAGLAGAVVAFLTTDLLGRGNPAQSSRADEPLMTAASAAEADIDRRLAAAPMVAGALHLALATAFESRNALAASRAAYKEAIASFGRAGVDGRADRIIAALRLAGLDAMSGEAGALARARAALEWARPSLRALGPREAEARVWYNAARGRAELLGGDVRVAGEAFTAAADAADRMPSVFDLPSRLRLRRQQALTYLRRARWTDAERLFTALREVSLAALGPRHPDTLELELEIGDTLSAMGRPGDAVAALDRIAGDVETVFGPLHQTTLDLLATRSGALSRLGSYQRAIADQRRLLARVETRDGEQGFFPLAARLDLAELECRAGQAAEGSALARATLDAARRDPGAGGTLIDAGSGKLAFCLVLAGEGEAARPLLKAIDTRRVAEMTSDPVYPAELALIRAAIDCRATRADEIAPIAAALDRGDADPFYRHWSKQLSAGCGPTAEIGRPD